MQKKADIIYQDEDMVVVNKPAGTLTIPGRSLEAGDSLLELLNSEFEKCYTVHRLDQLTSGVVCFAKTKEAHQNLSMQFQERRVKKIYQVLVEGNLDQDEGEINKPIGQHKTIAGKMTIAPKGKEALTFYKVVERFRNFTYLEADIKTGRTHQIRIHFQSIGHPLVVDSLYGKRDALFLSDIKTRGYRPGQEEEVRPLMQRNTLHAAKLTLFHPTTGNEMTFEAPMPKDFRAVMNQLRKWGVKRV
ncbi:MAG: RluA family pseudouridine synthase [Saprospiraceae bacterium]|nr:RluA family pseudouridine synthase [Saprospiraceae bacterium]MCB9323033.1 RluA family pseudouridine synthase [Lewinellaceae bacterium]